MTTTNDAPAPAPSGSGVREEESPLRFFSTNVDGWGAAEWFDRLAKAIREQDKAVVAGDMLTMETYRNIAASSAMRLVRDYEQQVRASLASDASPAPTSGSEDVRMVRFVQKESPPLVIEDDAKPASEPAGGDVGEAVWFGFDESTGEFTGEYSTVKPADTRGMIPFVRAEALSPATTASDAALSSSAGPAVEPVAWRQKFKSDPWTYHHAGWPYADSERAAGAIVEPLYPHPAPATVEMSWREKAAKWHDEQSRRINNLPLNTQRAEFHRECVAALAPATEGRKDKP